MRVIRLKHNLNVSERCSFSERTANCADHKRPNLCTINDCGHLMRAGCRAYFRDRESIDFVIKVYGRSNDKEPEISLTESRDRSLRWTRLNSTGGWTDGSKPRQVGQHELIVGRRRVF